MSMPAISCVADVSIVTVSKLLVEVGAACQKFHDESVVNVASQRLQCDEICSFVYAKDKNVENATASPDKAGDVWTWTGIDADSKLVISWLVAGRSAESADIFMHDVAARLKNRVQHTQTDISPIQSC